MWQNMRAYQTITNNNINANLLIVSSILSAIAHKLNVSGHVLIRRIFLVLVCVIRAQSLPASFSYTLYKSKDLVVLLGQGNLGGYATLGVWV
jgi:hypothetical protein